MGEMMEGTPAAKALGIYLGQLYGWIKSGKLKNHKKDGKYVTPDGKGCLVDIDDARAVWMASKEKGPRTPGEPRAKRTNSRRVANGDDGEVVAERKARQLKVGAIVSYETGKQANGTRLGPPHYTISQVLAANGSLTYLDDADKRRHYSGVQIGDVVLGTDRLSTMLAKGVARVEHPTHVLGYVLLAFVVEGKVDLAQSLEAWMIKNGVTVIVPEIIDLEEEDEPDPIRGKPVMIEEEDAANGQLAGDDD